MYIVSAGKLKTKQHAKNETENFFFSKNITPKLQARLCSFTIHFEEKKSFMLFNKNHHLKTRKVSTNMIENTLTDQITL